MIVNSTDDACCQDAAATEAANLETFTKEKLEDHQHQMNWERGQIDYLGVDSFDNILRKIETTISRKEEEEPVEVFEVAEVAAVAAVARVEPRPPPSDLDQTEHEEVFARGSPRRREVVTDAQLEECKRSPARRGRVRPRRKPMKGRGQQDHRERFVRLASARSQQPVAAADLQALAAGPS